MSYQDRMMSAHHFSTASASRHGRLTVDGGGGIGGGAIDSSDASGAGSSVYASTIVSMELEGEEARRAQQEGRLNDQQWVLQVREL